MAVKWFLLIAWLDGPVPVEIAPGPVAVFGHPALCEVAGRAIAAAVTVETGRVAGHRCVTGTPT